MLEPSISPAENSEGIRLFLDCLVLIVKHRVPVVGFTVLAAVLAVIVSLLLPKTWTATVKIMPPQQTKSHLEMLAQQIGSFGSLADADLGLRNPNDLYVSVMRTRVVEDVLIDRFGLQREYGMKLRSEVRKRLERNTDIDTGKDGLIVISVRDHDPHRAADLANGFAEQLKRVTLELADQEATERKRYFRKQLEITQNDLAQAEQAFRATEQKTGVIHLESQARALIESAAKLKAGLAAKEVELAGMRSFATPNNPQVIQLQVEIAAMRAKVAQVERGSQTGEGSDSANALANSGIAYQRAYREVMFQQTLLELLSKQFEAARLDEGRNSVVIQVLDPAVPPDLRTSPKRALIVIGTAVIAFFLAVAAVFVYEAIMRLRQNPEVAARLALLKHYLTKFPARA